jgi:Carboxypeptidase regulatory-like domain/TonB-dependent Receptor Plug Domain
MNARIATRAKEWEQMKVQRVYVMLLVWVAFFLAPNAHCQTIVTGGVAGTVTDETGAVIEGATVSLKSAATGEVQTQTTSHSGIYQFVLLKPGEYSLTVSREGFKTTVQTVSIQLGQTSTANTTLELGSTSLRVEVSSELPLLKTEDANLSTNFDTKHIQEVPNPGGDITYIAQTAPGVTMNSATGGGFGNFSTYGLPATSNLFTINGNDYNDAFLNLNNSGSSNLLLGGNEMQEVAVVNNAYTGQYGRQAASQVDYSTKAGTNAFHGNAVYNWTGSYLNANAPLAKATVAPGQPLPPRPFANNNQWAASFGGPILKDKLFFFLNNEGIRYIFGSIHSVTVPTPAFESFVLGQPAIAGSAPTLAFYQNIFKLYNGAPGIAKAVANPGSCTGNGFAAAPIGTNDQCTQSWTQSVSNGNREWLLSGRVDYAIDSTNQIFGRFKVDRGVQPTYTDSINRIFNDNSVQPQNEGQFNFTHTFSPTVVNNFIANLLWYSAIFGSTNPGPALALFPGNLAFSDGSMTNLGTGSGNPGGYGQAFFFPQGRNVTQWGLVDDLSITRGAHSFKMGANFRRDDVSDHTAQELTLYPAVNTTLVGFANDQVASFTQFNFAKTPVQPVAFSSWGLYFQDEFRVSTDLKLTLTLRADRNTGGACQHQCASLPVTPFPSLPHGADIPYNQSFQTGLTTILPGMEMIAFQPRFGLAWTPLGKNTVIRTGVGLFTDLYPGTILSGINTNFPQVNLWAVPGGTLAFDLQSPGATAFPSSGVSVVQQCNSAFATNYDAGGNLNTFLAAAPAACATTPTLNDVSRNLANPKFVEWNLQIQHTIGPRTVVSANYVGNRGYDLFYFNDDVNGFAFGNLPAAPADPRVGRVNFLNSGAISNYHGLTLSLQENNWHGLSGSFNYTYSHALDEISNGGVLPFSVITSVGTQINPYNIRDNYASADYDVRHQISATYIYELPFKSQNRALNYLIGGWQLSGTQFWRTSFPFSFIDGATIGSLTSNNLGGSTILLQPLFSQRNFPNAGACTQNACFGLAGTGSTAPFLLTTATNFTGTVGRNAFRGPGFVGGDMSLRKNFPITESLRLQLGLNAYNWINHANYGVPYPNTNAPFFGQTAFMQTPPTSPYGAFAAAATDMRMTQITAKLIF